VDRPPPHLPRAQLLPRVYSLCRERSTQDPVRWEEGEPVSEPWLINIVAHVEMDPRTLLPHPLNPRLHPPEQDAVVEASLSELGWLKSVILNETTGRLLDGHDRVKLAIARGEASVPVEVVRVREEEEGKALLLLDPSGMLAQTHWERWAKLRAEAHTEAPALLAFWDTYAQAQRGRAEEPPPAPTVVEEPGIAEGRGEALAEAWQTAPGQVWVCGEHVVICGDATEPWAWAVVTRHAGQVGGCVTSPPYAEQRAKAYGGVPAEAYVAWFQPVAAALEGALAEYGSFFLNLKEHSEGIARPVYVHQLVVAMVEVWGWTLLDTFCAPRPGIPGDAHVRGKFKNQWEPVYWFAREVRPVFHPERARHWSEQAVVRGHWNPHNLAALQGQGGGALGRGVHTRTGPGWAEAGNLLPYFASSAALGHPATFPVDFAAFFVEVYSDVGDWWVDPFLGAGSTLLACDRLGRRCVGIERDPASVAITLERVQEATGTAPILRET
jgi:site-specific DNA-methyltransferase (adenine-specific)